MRKKLLQNILFAAMAAWAIYGSGLTAPLGFDEPGGQHLVAAQALR
jgi:hypothetical protein